MLSPTPLLRQSPLDVGSVFSGAFAILRRRFGLFLVLSLFPTLVAVGTAVVAVFLLLGTLLPIVINARTAPARPDDLLRVGASLIVGYLVAVIVSWLVQAKALGMMSLGAYETAQGQGPTFRGLMSRSRGFLPRIVPVQLAIGLGIAVAYGLFIVGLVSVVAGTSGRGSNAAAGTFFLATTGFFLVALVVAVLLAVRWLYLTPTVAIEQTGGFAGLGRSWQLTRGAFWRTFGYSLLGGLAVAAVSMALSGATQALGGTMAGQVNSQTDPRILLAAMAPVLIGSLAAQGLVQLFATPFLAVYQTVMFIDQVRRVEEPTAAAWFAPGQPSAGAGWPPAPQPGMPTPGGQWGQSPQQAQQAWGAAPQAPWGQAPAQPQAPWGQAPQPSTPWGQPPAQPQQPWNPAPTWPPTPAPAQPWTQPTVPVVTPAEPTPATTPGPVAEAPTPQGAEPDPSAPPTPPSA